MLKKIIFITIVILLIAAGFYYWFSLREAPAAPGTPVDTTSRSFNPFARSTIAPSLPPRTTATSTPAVGPVVDAKIPVLRHLSLAPIGGFMASTTVVRYIDRGVGHVYEASSETEVIRKISNTTIPRVYESYWNKNLSAAVLRYIKDSDTAIQNFYAELRPLKNSTSTQTADFIPYEIKGKFLSPDIQEIAVSPKRDRIFTFSIENGKGIGYVSGFDESKKVKVLDTPLTQVGVEWPEENTIVITTKPSGISSGFAYLLDVKKASFTKVLGGMTGLSTKMSADAKKILFSTTRPSGPVLSLYTTKDGTTQEVVFRTFADKCVWSKVRPHEAYCAVPSKFDAGMYPDDWYKGAVSFVDQLWLLDSITGEVHLLANLLTLSNDLIDAVDLTLDPKENFLYFVNKRDLTLWSLDLNES